MCCIIWCCVGRHGYTAILHGARLFVYCPDGVSGTHIKARDNGCNMSRAAAKHSSYSCHSRCWSCVEELSEDAMVFYLEVSRVRGRGLGTWECTRRPSCLLGCLDQLSTHESWSRLVVFVTCCHDNASLCRFFALYSFVVCFLCTSVFCQPKSGNCKLG